MQMNQSTTKVKQLPQPFLGDRLQLGLESLVNRGLALLILILLSPALTIIGFFIWRQDGAPLTFGHYRVGKHGQLFKCLKFRTMVRDSAVRLEELLATSAQARAEWERDHKLTNDPRVTRIGKFLRKTSLDELPQLVNVLRGEMNLVGPRPITVPELAKYGNVRHKYLSATPGMTGLWQVSGRNELTYSERVVLDNEYIENRCISLDISILMKTVGVVVFGKGAR